MNGRCCKRFVHFLQGTLPEWMKNARFCFYWRSTGGQCGMQGPLSQYHCVPIGRWTEPYRDDTDGRPFGCEMAWGILL